MTQPKTAAPARPASGRVRAGDGARGQILVIFAMSSIVLFGVLALVIDVGNLWNASLHVQHAAEAAALAGVPYMPGDFATATTRATEEAKKNHYSTATGSTVTTAVNIESDRRLDVTISQPVATFFMRVLGINTVRITRTATAEYNLPVPMGSPLDGFGDTSSFRAVVASQGSDRGNGDAFGAYYNPKSPSSTLNAQYNPKGYDYAIEVPAGAGSTSIDLYDPTFCAVDPTKGVGDRWLNSTSWPWFSTYFTLWSDPAATPLDYTDDVVVQASGTLFEHKRQVDKSNKGNANLDFWDESITTSNYSSAQVNAYWALPNCQTDIYHNAWWTLTTVTTPGTYRLNVTTTDALNPLGDQLSTSGSNKWGLRALSSSSTYKAKVYGLGRIAIYANVTASTPIFYLARIEAVHAGKSMVIQLFDPGDNTGNSSIQILQPTATGYTPATFSYTADSNAASCCRSGTGLTTLPTTVSSSPRYNNSWVTLTVPLPKTYTAPHPSTEPATVLGGWWKIKYIFDNETTDSTTWQVSIRGNPVHLVQP